ncbi:hypothetical protein WMY93_021490 [Mugilogobius chulae]|uniref:Protein FAM19A5 n=1 Tax=Mugilogobius chulae TaxID=88201 RepID=A0AAW0NC44_9GOBI
MRKRGAEVLLKGGKSVIIKFISIQLVANGNITFRVVRANKMGNLMGQLAAGTCEIVTLDRDSSQPRRTIARQTARCACKKGQIAGTTRARPACVDGKRVLRG